MSYLLIADDEESIRMILQDLAKEKGLEPVVAKDGKEALKLLQSQSIDVALLDIRMPGMTGLEILDYQNQFLSRTQIIIMTAQDTMENAVDAMKKGAFEYISKPFDLDELSVLIDKALENSKMLKELNRLKTKENRTQTQSAIVGTSRAMKEIFKTIGKVANEDVTVLIHGESGTGKELIAKAVHYQGKRCEQPFIAVNCAAIPDNLLESELFGYKKGAFTGASEDKIGYLQRANKGTIFLDEIGEMPLALQAKILRFMQSKTIQRLGETHTTKLDVRILAATNVNMESAVSKGDFREDLYFRLNVVPIHVPPLRERPDDIKLLVSHFLDLYGQSVLNEKKSFSKDALKYLYACPWPGNVRELENTIKRSLVLSRGAVITRADIEQIQQNSEAQVYKGGSVEIDNQDLEQIIFQKIQTDLMGLDLKNETDLYLRYLHKLEKPLLEILLKQTGGNQVQAAQILGINRNTLRKKLRELHMVKG